MVQKTKIHLLSSDVPIESVVDSIDAIEIPTRGWYGDINFSSIELDVHVTCADDINKLMYKLAELQELFEPIAEEDMGLISKIKSAGAASYLKSQQEEKSFSQAMTDVKKELDEAIGQYATKGSDSSESFTVDDFSAEELEVLNKLFPLPEGAFRPTFAHVGLPFVKAVKEIVRLRNILRQA